jgi:hypothetical protein
MRSARNTLVYVRSIEPMYDIGADWRGGWAWLVYRVAAATRPLNV